MVTRNALLSLLVLPGVLICLLVRPSDAMEVGQIDKFFGSDVVNSDAWGFLASDGDIAVIGAQHKNSIAGAAYVFRFDGASWSEEQKLTASDTAAGDRFGSVAMSGDAIVVGARGDESFLGAAYVYRFDGSMWVEEQKLIASDGVAGDAFGSFVGMDGDTIAVGSNHAGDRGAIYVFRFDGTTWVETQKLTTADGEPMDQFGNGVVVNGDTILGAARNDDANAGAAYVFRYVGSTWIEEQKLVASDREPSDTFGVLALDGDRALIGARNDDNTTGAVYAFRFDGTSWVEEAKITAPSPQEGGGFGGAIALDGNRALIGASGEDNTRGFAYLYAREGSEWVAQQRLGANDGEAMESFGAGVAFSRSTILVTSLRGDGGGANSGAGYAFSTPLCLTGAINAGNDRVTDVLYIDGSNGGPERTVEVSEGDFFTVAMLKPPAGGNGRFVLHADAGAPSFATETLLPFEVGRTCFPFLMTQGATPVIVANNVGKHNLLGSSHFYGTGVADPEPAETDFRYWALPLGTVLTFQAILIDPAAVSAKGASATNVVVLEVVE